MEIDPVVISTTTILLVLAVFLAGMVYVLLRESRRRRAAFEGVLNFLRGEVPEGKLFTLPSFHGEYRSASLEILYEPGTKHRPEHLVIFLGSPALALQLRVGREGFAGALLDAVGMSFDLATGDTAFDSVYRLASSNGDEALRYLAQAGVKERIDSLFGRGAAGLELLPGDDATDGALRLRVEVYGLEHHLSEAGLMPMLEELYNLRPESLPGFSASSERPRRELYGA